MKRLLGIVIFCTLFLGTGGSLLTPNFTPDAVFAAPVAGGGAPPNAQPPVNGANAIADPFTDPNKSGGCVNILLTFVSCVNAGIVWIIKFTFLQIAGFLLWLTANMLTYAIQIGVLQFATWAPDTLYPIWVIIRQVTSLFVVFAGLYLGFMYIIGKGDEFKRYVPWIVMFGLFVNFSYPLTRTLVDISNIVSLNIYASAVGADALNPGSPNSPGSLIAGRLGIPGLLSSATKESTDTGAAALSQINSIPGALMSVVFVVYAAWVFFMATAIFIGRTATLVFLIVASPLLFVDSVIPALGKKAAELRQMFFSQLVVAPVFMIMFALTLKFLDVFRAGFVQPGQPVSAVVEFFNLLIMIVMLRIMIKVTKSISGGVGDFATNAIGTVGGFALGAASGGTGLIARASIGRAAGAVRDSSWVKNNQNSVIGRSAHTMSNSLASSTFDARNSSFVKTKLEKVGLGMGMGMGTGTKYNYQQTVENRNKDRMERYERIDTRYKEDVYDPKTGAILYRKGDANQEGIKAAAKFRESQGRTVTGTGLTGALKRADRFVFNKGTLDKEFEKSNEKLNAEDQKAVEKEIADLTKGYTTNAETGRAATLESKGKYIKDLEDQISKVKQTDPQLGGIHGQALVKSYKELTKKYEDDMRAGDEQEKKLLGAYTSTDGAGRAKMTRENQDDKQLQKKMNIVGEYISVENDLPDARKKKVDALLKLDNSESAKAVIENDTFGNMQDDHTKKMETANAALLQMARGTPEEKLAYDAARKKIEEDKQKFNQQLRDERKALLDEYNARATQAVDLDLTGNVPQQPRGGWTGRGDTDIPAYQRQAAAGEAPRTGQEAPVQQTQQAVNPNWAGQGDTNIPAYQRQAAAGGTTSGVGAMQTRGQSTGEPSSQQSQSQAQNYREEPTLAQQQDVTLNQPSSQRQNMTLETESQANARTNNYTLETPEQAESRTNAPSYTNNQQSRPNYINPAQGMGSTVPTQAQQPSGTSQPFDMRSMSFAQRMRANKNGGASQSGVTTPTQATSTSETNTATPANEPRAAEAA